MKNIIAIIILVVSTFAKTWSQECTTMWPYIYPEFMQGTLYMADKTELNAQFNVHVKEGRLHYLSNGKIMETLSENIVLVKIGDDLYMCVEGRVMKVIGSEERGFVATLILGDFDQLFNSGGAYGSSSSSSSTKKLIGIEIGGVTIVNYMELRQRLDQGQSIPLKYKYYIVTKGKVYPATKRDINAQLNETESAEFRLFLKNHKIKWKDANSLLTLLDYFNK